MDGVQRAQLTRRPPSGGTVQLLVELNEIEAAKDGLGVVEDVGCTGPKVRGSWHFRQRDLARHELCTLKVPAQRIGLYLTNDELHDR